eukprot:748043-Hanusia_phi.AAC.3
MQQYISKYLLPPSPTLGILRAFPLLITVTGGQIDPGLEDLSLAALYLGLLHSQKSNALTPPPVPQPARPPPFPRAMIETGWSLIQEQDLEGDAVDGGRVRES